MSPKPALRGAFEYGIAPRFAIHGNIAHHDFGCPAQMATPLRCKASINSTMITAYAAYFRRDYAGGANGSDTIMICWTNASRDHGQISIEGYLCGFSEAASDGTLLGASGRFAYRRPAKNSFSKSSAASALMPS
jgi:hypothetical protein